MRPKAKSSRAQAASATAIAIADPGDAASEPPQRLEFEIVEDAGDWKQFGDYAALIHAAMDKLARAPELQGHMPASACIALSSDAAVRELNRTWRHQDKPTNVLSFPAVGPAPTAAAPPFLGDIVLACGVLAREARELGSPAAQHLQHLVIHGLLHLMGFDHETDADALVMEGLETRILATLGIADPYTTAE